ncbi:uracil-DNA glycosylase [Candidatus Campbellbacteria bacterium]|nr:uracil-DNA glycosylase [Candidatus Campbellbacteria bacterium]|tara:strand:+ start:11778 stop:12443 length:666 start_codon:yes stop_codon:yes gene_type:complete
MKADIDPTWSAVLADYFTLPKWQKLAHFIENEYQTNSVYPQRENLFNAFNITPFSAVKVVIVGQDPYHNPGQAHGLSFSVPGDITVPPSLKNIYKEIETDLHLKKDFSNGNLTSWAQQGVLLLNSVLTVQKDKPGSHSNQGWEDFTDYVIKKISEEHQHIVFLLWGNYAKNKGQIIDRSKHLVLESSHPSPLGAYRGFIGSQHFSQANMYLKKYKKKEIDW